MNKKLRKKLTKIARANIAVGLIVVAMLADNNVDFAKKHDEIIFINSSVIRTEEFVNSLPHNAEVIYLDRNKSGLDQITEHLAREEDVDAVRIISHGNSGYMVLNGQVIDEEFLADHSKAVSSWKDALTEDADIMLYGCKIAATDEGKSFVKQLAELTGADVAAATEQIGGKLANWTLDYKLGDIEAVTLRINDYEFHLANQVVTDNGDSGAGTLRQAIIDAGNGDEITFNLSGGSETITILSQLDINKGLTIDGDNTSGSGTDVTVQVTTPGAGGTVSRVFEIDTDNTVNLSNMTIKGGDISSLGFPNNSGGGIFIDSPGPLNIDNCIISGSKATYGGGINNYYGTIGTISNSTISGNSANANGAGIRNVGTISTISNSTISGNTALQRAGGIWNYGTISTIQNSTISGNTATNVRGGGIYVYAGSITLVNSTISGNTAGGNGGGIYHFDGEITVKNTIIANNTANSADNDYYYLAGTLTDNGYNIVEYSNVAANATGGFDNANDILYNTKYGVAGTSFTSWTQNASVLTNQNLNLSSTLADNGGSTQTLALSVGSFAIDAGTATGAPTTDQRGDSRVGDPDIGSYEWQGYVWDGSSSTAWATGANWNSGSMPTTQDIYIPDETNDPVISTTTERTVDNLDIGTGGSLTVQDDGKLSVSGDLSNSGTLTLESSATGTGSLIVNGTATGDVTVQRYIEQYSTATDGWHFISSPVATFNIDGSDFDPGANDDLFRWEESTSLWMNHKAGDPTQLVTGTGYLVAYESTATKDFTGTLNGSDKTWTNLSYTSSNEPHGWHLLGNPYPSSLLWDATSWSRSNVDGTAKIWNEGNESYTDVSQNGAIPATQGFMVYVSSGTNSITIPLADRSHNSQNWYKNSEVNKIKLTVFDIEKSNAQESIVKFNENATSGFDSEYDSRFLAGYAPQFYSVINEAKLSTNALPEITAQSTIPMSFIKNESSSFYIEVEGVNDLQPQETVYLTDLKTNQTQILNDNPVYNFTSEDGDMAERFVIHFSPLGIDDMVITDQLNIFAAYGKVELRNNKPIDAKIHIYNISGQLLTSKELINESSASIDINNYKGPAVVSIITNEKVINKKVIIW